MFNHLIYKGMDRSFDMWDNIPQDMRTYLQNYGFNFSEKMCEWAVSMMKNAQGKITPMKKEEVEAMLKKYGVQLEKDNGYNCVYVANMAKNDYWGAPIANEQMLAQFIKSYIDDPDYPTSEKAFRHFFADMMGFGKVINWKDML